MLQNYQKLTTLLTIHSINCKVAVCRLFVGLCMFHFRVKCFSTANIHVGPFVHEQYTYLFVDTCLGVC